MQHRYIRELEAEMDGSGSEKTTTITTTITTTTTATITQSLLLEQPRCNEGLIDLVAVPPVES